MSGIFMQVTYLHHLVSFSEAGREGLTAHINDWTERAREEFVTALAHQATSSDYGDIAAYHYLDSFAPAEALIPTYAERDREIRAAEQNRHDALVEEARRTGKPVVIRRWEEPDEEDGYYYHALVMTLEGRIETRTTHGY